MIANGQSTQKRYKQYTSQYSDYITSMLTSNSSEYQRQHCGHYKIPELQIMTTVNSVLSNFVSDKLNYFWHASTVFVTQPVQNAAVYGHLDTDRLLRVILLPFSIHLSSYGLHSIWQIIIIKRKTKSRHHYNSTIFVQNVEFLSKETAKKQNQMKTIKLSIKAT